MKQLSYFVITYAIILLFGGLIGFIKAGSIASLLMSNVFCGALLICAVGMKRSFSWGFYGAFALSVMLVTFFAYRFFLTQQFMPSGLMLLLSAMMVGRLLYTKTQIASSL